jgi:hypothetical protein
LKEHLFDSRSPQPTTSGTIAYMADNARAAEAWHGFRMAHLFPVEGDSAIAELWHDEEVWADVRLEGVRQTQPR